MAEPTRVLVVGQTPPPYHGQAIMIERLLRQDYKRVEMRHVRLEFSPSIESVGRPSLRKALHLARVVWQIVTETIRFRPQVLYYPPAGPDRLPMYRDIILLLVARRLIPRTVFHFHASGLSRIASRLRGPEDWLFRLAYSKPDVAISLSNLNPPDHTAVKAKRVRYIPYGIEDHFGKRDLHQPGSREAPVVLFVGAIRESKGLSLLVEALSQLKTRGVPFTARLVGQFVDPDFEVTIQTRVRESSLHHHVSFLGELTGDAKWQEYHSADVFCFPTHYESESFGVVLLEAMQSALPIVATRWRGIPSIVCDGTTGYLVPIHDSQAIADRLQELLLSPSLRRSMGQSGRMRYLEEFTVEKWKDRIEAALLEATVEPER